MVVTKEGGTRVSAAAYGSDVIVDVLQGLGIEYVALNPGATFRGLHDSVVNYGGNRPETILCTHEGIAVAIAHGYGRAAGKPMAAAVHDIVGLLHATNAMFNAWMQRASVLVLGGTGPMPVEQRRPWIDWIHTALVQGNAVREFVKWDDQPASVPSFAESIIRAYQISVTEPKGPTYLCFDAGLQEVRLDEPIVLPDLSRYPPPSRVQADLTALEEAADLLFRAEHPVVLADSLGKSPAAVEGLIRLAEGLGLPVAASGSLFAFPSRHPLNLSGAADELLKDADVVLSLDVYDLESTLTTTDRVERRGIELMPEDAKLIDISLRQFSVKSWADDYGRLRPIDLPIAADTAVAVPALAELCLRKAEAEPSRKSVFRDRAARHATRHDEMIQQWEERATRSSNEKPIARPFLAQQVREAVKGDDVVITNNDLAGWGRRLWDLREPHQLPSASGGTGNGLAVSIGVALANKGTGRLCVNFQSDGDMMYNPGALWTAANQKIPLLIVMNNNRSYYNDGDHQKDMARVRERPIENWGVGINVEEPFINFAGLARDLGIYGEGPIEDPKDLPGALERARKVVVEEGRCALVDVVTPRSGRWL